jgi:hypothetical protein
VTASMKLTPWARRFALAFDGSHSIRTPKCIDDCPQAQALPWENAHAERARLAIASRRSARTRCSTVHASSK